MIERARRRPGVSYALLASGVLTVGLFGFLGFRIFPSLGVPSATGAALMGFAAAAGVASFFSPCSFPLLVTLLTRQSSKEGARPLRFSLALSLGVASFLLLLGAGLGAGGAALFGKVTFESPQGRVLRLVVGSILVSLGMAQAGFIPWLGGAVATNVKRRLRITSRLNDQPIAKFALFGFAYVLAGFG